MQENKGVANQNESKMCFKYRKLGKMKADCPLLNKKKYKKKKKVICATWDELIKVKIRTVPMKN